MFNFKLKLMVAAQGLATLFAGLPNRALKKRGSLGICVLLPLLGLMPTMQVSAQDYPTRAVTLVVPVPPGSGADIVGRLVAKGMEERLGQPVVVRNQAGGGAIIGAQAVARSTADGYTLLMTAGGQAILPSIESKLPFDVVADFTPVALLTSGPIVLVARKNFPADTIQEMILYAKKYPKRVTFGDPGKGTVPTLATYMLGTAGGVEFLPIGYRGGAPALLDVVAGNIDMYFSAVSPVIQHVQSGNLKALGLSSANVPDFIKAIPALASVKPIADQGFPGFDVGLTYGIFAPVNTPINVIARLETAIGDTMKSQEVRDALSSLGIEARYMNSQDYRRYFQSEINQWAKVVKSQPKSEELIRLYKE